MGSGFKSFTAGAVLTASDMNNYLMEQSVMSFATTDARNTALSSPEEGMVAVITGSDLVTIYTGSTWVEYGRYGAWLSYTPTWTNLTVGNGTVVANYVRVGSMVTYAGKITVGSTTSISGFVLVSLPITAQDSFMDGSARYSDDGTRSYVGSVSISASGTTLGFTHSESGGFGSWNATNPFTIAANDLISWNITYQAA
jgi:hypothetical protein